MKKLLSNLNHWKTNHRAIPLILFLLLTCGYITAQTKVSGTVSDENGLTLPGANVLVVGSTKSVSTDIDGKYEIDVPQMQHCLFHLLVLILKNCCKRKNKN